MALVLGTEHALRDVAAPARFSAGVIARPPLHREGYEEDRHPLGRVVHGGEHACFGSDVRVGQQRIQSPYRIQVQDVPAGPNRANHGQDELYEVGENDRPQSAQCAVQQGDGAGDEQGQPAGPAQQNAAQFDGSERNGPHHEHIEDQPQVQRPKPAQHSSGFAAIAQLIKFNVRHHARSAPQPSVHENGEHAGEQKGPPPPVAADTLLPNKAGDKVGGVGRERGRDHADAQQPPRHVAAGKEKPRCRVSDDPRCPDADAEGQQKVCANDGPIQCCNLHATRIINALAIRAPCVVFVKNPRPPVRSCGQSSRGPRHVEHRLPTGRYSSAFCWRGSRR